MAKNQSVQPLLGDWPDVEVIIRKALSLIRGSKTEIYEYDKSLDGI